MTCRHTRRVRTGRVPIASNRAHDPTKNALKPWLGKRWCIGKSTGDYLWHMEDVISLDEEPYDPMRPVVGFDERPCQWLGEGMAPMPMQPGRSKRQHDD